jgi:hypothetical protein
VRLEGLGKFKKFIHLIGSRTRDLSACSIVPQPTTLPRVPYYIYIYSTDVLEQQVFRNCTNCLVFNIHLRGFTLKGVILTHGQS